MRAKYGKTTALNWCCKMVCKVACSLVSQMQPTWNNLYECHCRCAIDTQHTFFHTSFTLTNAPSSIATVNCTLVYVTFLTPNYQWSYMYELLIIISRTFCVIEKCTSFANCLYLLLQIIYVTKYVVLFMRQYLVHNEFTQFNSIYFTFQ